MSLHAIFEESVQRWKIRQNQLARTWVKHHIDLKLIAQQGSYLVLARALREHIMPPPHLFFANISKNGGAQRRQILVSCAQLKNTPNMQMFISQVKMSGHQVR